MNRTAMEAHLTLLGYVPIDALVATVSDPNIWRKLEADPGLRSVLADWDSVSDYVFNIFIEKLKQKGEL